MRKGNALSIWIGGALLVATLVACAGNPPRTVLPISDPRPPGTSDFTNDRLARLFVDMAFGANYQLDIKTYRLMADSPTHPAAKFLENLENKRFSRWRWLNVPVTVRSEVNIDARGYLADTVREFNEALGYRVSGALMKWRPDRDDPSSWVHWDDKAKTARMGVRLAFLRGERMNREKYHGKVYRASCGYTVSGGKETVATYGTIRIPDYTASTTGISSCVYGGLFGAIGLTPLSRGLKDLSVLEKKNGFRSLTVFDRCILAIYAHSGLRAGMTHDDAKVAVQAIISEIRPGGSGTPCAS